MIEQLLSYRRLGLDVIPLKGKIPLVKWKDYVFNPNDFARPGVNIGVKAGLLPNGDHLWFVDLDSKEALGPFFEAHPNLKCVPLVSTSRGFHLWLTWKRPAKTRTFVGGEIRGEGAYVVAPPSVHESGHVYKFIVPLRGTPPMYDSEWLSVMRKERPAPDPSPKTAWKTEEPYDRWAHYKGVKRGSRHDTLLRMVGGMFNSGYTVEQAYAYAMEWNKRNSPPLGVVEIRRAVWGIYEQEKYDLRLPCAGCGAPWQGTHTRDHIVAIALGGSEDQENKQTLCAKCTKEKNSEDMRKIAAKRSEDSRNAHNT